MEKEDSHIVAFNISSSIGSNTRVLTLFPDNYEVWVLHFEDYFIGHEKHGSYIWKSISQGPHLFSKTKFVYFIADYERLRDKCTYMITKEKEKLENDLKAKREIRFALALNTFRLVSSCKTTNDIWNV